MNTPNFAGYWTGSFEGTNSGGISFGLDQRANVLGGVATMQEPAFGVYQYVISGQVGAPTKLRLNPASHVPNVSLGVIDAQCSLSTEGILRGTWKSSIGTNGIFEARRYVEQINEDPAKPKRTNVFISYSHQDKLYLDRLLIHLRPLERSGLIDPWSDLRILGGSLWKTEIERGLARANAAVLLVSADFLASSFIVENELPPLLARAEKDGVRILPVIVKPCRFTRDSTLSVFQALNEPKKPLASLPEWEQDLVLDQIAHTIEKLTG